LIPALVIFIGVDQHIAQSVNLLFFIPTAVVALFIHFKNKRVNLKMAIPIVAFGLIGAFFGSKMAIGLSGTDLKKWFGFFLLAMGIYEMFRKDKAMERRQKNSG